LLRSLGFSQQASAEINAPMINHARAAQKNRTLPTQHHSASKIKLVQQSSNLDADLWSKLERNLEPAVKAAGNVLGNIYASVAQVVLE
jgi:hypothetical protein